MNAPNRPGPPERGDSDHHDHQHVKVTLGEREFELLSGLLKSHAKIEKKLDQVLAELKRQGEQRTADALVADACRKTLLPIVEETVQMLNVYTPDE